MYSVPKKIPSPSGGETEWGPFSQNLARPLWRFPRETLIEPEERARLLRTISPNFDNRALLGGCQAARSREKPSRKIRKNRLISFGFGPIFRPLDTSALEILLIGFHRRCKVLIFVV